ncbi:MAG: hypothetical protein K0B07_04440 [DPANN group archaeon]|nr:hypothetical protein [DPANN group archaeon]
MVNKKRTAMSTFLAMVLMVLFTMIVGGFVGSWMIDTAKSQTENAINNSDSGCVYASINVRNIYYNDSGTEKIRFTIENTGTRTLTINNIRVIGNNSNSALFESIYMVYPGDEIPVIEQIDSLAIPKISSIRVIPSECPTKAVTIQGYEIN